MVGGVIVHSPGKRSEIGRRPLTTLRAVNNAAPRLPGGVQVPKKTRSRLGRRTILANANAVGDCARSNLADRLCNGRSTYSFFFFFY